MAKSERARLTSADCMGKNAPYFTDEEHEQPCGGNLYLMEKFWLRHFSGKLDAVICAKHALTFMHRQKRGYLVERIEQAMKQAMKGAPHGKV